MKNSAQSTNEADPIERGPQIKKTTEVSKTIRANKRKAKLKAKHRRLRVRVTAQRSGHLLHRGTAHLSSDPGGSP
jgi:hypothetical protein